MTVRLPAILLALVFLAASSDLSGTARTVTYDVAAPTIGVLAIDLTGPGATTATLSLPGLRSNFLRPVAAAGLTVHTDPIGL
jgi:hypothetical protein